MPVSRQHRRCAHELERQLPGECCCEPKNRYPPFYDSASDEARQNERLIRLRRTLFVPRRSGYLSCGWCVEMATGTLRAISPRPHPRSHGRGKESPVAMRASTWPAATRLIIVHENGRRNRLAWRRRWSSGPCTYASSLRTTNARCPVETLPRLPPESVPTARATSEKCRRALPGAHAAAHGRQDIRRGPV